MPMSEDCFITYLAFHINSLIIYLYYRFYTIPNNKSNLFLLADPLSYWTLIYAQVERSSRTRVLGTEGSVVPITLEAITPDTPLIIDVIM
jgi:hypothetical protein